MNFTLYKNITGKCAAGILILAENTTIDCNGYSIIGQNVNNSVGIYSKGRNTTIRNCQISNFTSGIIIKNASFGKVLTNNISTLGSFAIQFSNSNYFNISDNHLFSNMSALYILGSSNGYIGNNDVLASVAEPIAIVENIRRNRTADNNTIEFNTFVSLRRYAIYMQNASNNTFHNNIFTSKENNTITIISGKNNTFWGNVVNGKVE